MATAKKLRFKYQAKEVTKRVLKSILAAGVISVAASSPFFVTNLIRYYKQRGWSGWNKKRRKKLSDTFTYLKRAGLIRVEVKNNQIYISLTKEGKKRAGYYQIDELEIRKPKKWDKKWRILIFDIPEDVRMKREALRGKLIELNFYQLQKSVWLYPHNCLDELKLLQSFFGLEDQHYLLIETTSISSVEKGAVKFFSHKKIL